MSHTTTTAGHPGADDPGTALDDHLLEATVVTTIRPESVDRVPGPPAGQPISGGFFDPLTEEQKRDISRRLATMFPLAEPGDFWAKDIQPCAPCTEGTSLQSPSSQPEDR